MFERVFLYSDDIITKYGDPRVLNFPTMDSPKTMIWTIIIYLGFIKIILPKFMEKRKPIELKKIMFYYNILQVLLNVYIFLEVTTIWYHKYSFWKCNSVDYSNTPLARRALNISYYYYLCKYTEFLDTVFFILRKKMNQVSFLHIYHHSSMPAYTWIAVKFYGGGSIILNGLLNSLIHIVMYTYYLISGLGPQYQKYVWWKKYMTAMQLLQFTACLIHLGIAFYVGECNISNYFLTILTAHGIILFLFFSNFYKKEYNKSVPINTNRKSELTPDDLNPYR